MSTGKIKISFKLNGNAVTVETAPMARLLDVVRENLHLTGTKEGCGEGECGACSVLMNGELVNACLVPAAQLEGTDILTIEGLAQGKQLDAIQKSFHEQNATQCGICSPGMILATVYLLRKNPNPNEQEIRTALAGNLCRCTGYEKIFDAVSVACKREGLV